tara:strand:- start:344 stop:529 length:186 start_codon:yes stop_codon:yes gene_type:complete
MNTVKYNKGGKLKVSQKTMEVSPPDGYHWMMEGGRYFLMKGDYKPHDKAVAKAKFKLVNHG